MGKKVNLNKPRNNSGILKNNHHSHLFNMSQNYNNNSEEQSNSSSPLKKKAAEVAMRGLGVPKDAAKYIANDERLLNQATGQGILKIPLPVKVMLTILPFAGGILALLFFVIVIAGEEVSGSAISGSFMYGTTCPTVTVTDSGCNSNGENCTNKYDGNVELEDYIAGVVAAEVGGANNLEYYKVAAVTARTYFLSHTGDDCTIKGNATAQSYMDVDNSSNATLIKQAVEETKDQVLVKNDDLSKTNYASACVVNADDEYYYIRYGTSSLGKANFQKIPKEWDSDKSHAYSGYLEDWYSMVDQSSTDYENKRCPNNHDYGMSQLGALYLITEEDYTYDEVLQYYFGENVEIKKNEMQLSGSSGYINPTRYIKCSSAYGYRIHPVHKIKKFHSGLDIGISGGEPIYAAQDGTISYVRKSVNSINNCNYGYGNYITIKHEDGKTTLYAHIKYGTIPDNIVAGAKVSQGEQIGQVGSTGCSTGNHLHYEVKENGKTLDPADYLDLSNAKGTCRR